MSYSKSLFNFNKIFKFLKFFFIIELLIAVLESFILFKMPISRYSSLSAYFGKEPQQLTKDDIIFNLINSSPPTGFHWDTNELALSMVLIYPFFLCYKKITAKSLKKSIVMIIIMSASRAVYFLD